MKDSFDGICRFRKEHPGKPGSGLKTSDPRLSGIKADLERLRNKLEERFKLHRGIQLEVEASKGVAVFPFVPHVCILPPNQSVSNGIYVALCFDKLGRGALVGCAESKTNSQGLCVVTRKQRGKELKIDVDGSSSTTKYNNVFANPKEFYFPIDSEEELLRHIERSIDLALIELGYEINMIGDIPGTYDTGAGDEDLEDIEAKDENDARERTLRSIVARRGQRKFRNELIAVYKQCVITGCTVTRALEAAHIIGYNGKRTNHVQNGLLLRSDIHTLYDLGLISINPDSLKVEIDDELKGSEYENFEGKYLSGLLASEKALIHHYENVFQSSLSEVE
ncbi:HNH endonuclease [Photobacterium sp. DNB22_13_2]